MKWADLTNVFGVASTLTIMKEVPMSPGGRDRCQRCKKATDIVVVGICDGETATSQGAIDAKMLAQLSIPIVLLCTDAFLKLARISFPEKLDDVHLVMIPHPLSSLTTDETFALATSSFNDFVGSLTKGIDYNHVLESHDTKFTNDELNSLF